MLASRRNPEWLGRVGSYWLSAIPDLSNFYVPEQGSVHGDDPNPDVNKFNATYKAVTGSDPSSQYVIQAMS